MPVVPSVLPTADDGRVLMALGITATVIGALLAIIPVFWGAGTQRRNPDAASDLEAQERPSYRCERPW